MSHIVSIQTEVRDAVAVQSACRRLSLPEPVQRTVKLYSAEATGLAVELPGWRYPVVCELDCGRLRFDNFNERWGRRQELDRFVQSYTVEKTKIEARRRGHGVIEQPLADGSIKLTLQIGGAA
jgi:hypothetical protein